MDDPTTDIPLTKLEEKMISNHKELTDHLSTIVNDTKFNIFPGYNTLCYVLALNFLGEEGMNKLIELDHLTTVLGNMILKSNKSP